MADKCVLGIPSRSRRINREMIYRMLVGQQPLNGFYSDRDEKVVELARSSEGTQRCVRSREVLIGGKVIGNQTDRLDMTMKVHSAINYE